VKIGGKRKIRSLRGRNLPNKRGGEKRAGRFTKRKAMGHSSNIEKTKRWDRREKGKKATTLPSPEKAFATEREKNGGVMK